MCFSLRSITYYMTTVSIHFFSCISPQVESWPATLNLLWLWHLPVATIHFKQENHLLGLNCVSFSTEMAFSHIIDRLLKFFNEKQFICDKPRSLIELRLTVSVPRPIRKLEFILHGWEQRKQLTHEMKNMVSYFWICKGKKFWLCLKDPWNK